MSGMPEATQSDDGLSPQFALPRTSEAGLQFQGLRAVPRAGTQAPSSGQQEVCQRHSDGDTEPLDPEKPGRHRQRQSLSEPAWRHLAARSLTCTRGLHPPARRPGLALEPPPARPPVRAQSAAAFAAEKRAPNCTSPLTPHAGIWAARVPLGPRGPIRHAGSPAFQAVCAPWHTAGCLRQRGFCLGGRSGG